MTRDEHDNIFRMVQEAGFRIMYTEVSPWMARFAALVAADEREACAKLCEELAERNKKTDAHAGWVLGNTECADAIRARNE